MKIGSDCILQKEQIHKYLYTFTWIGRQWLTFISRNDVPLTRRMIYAFRSKRLILVNVRINEKFFSLSWFRIEDIYIKLSATEWVVYRRQSKWRAIMLSQPTFCSDAFEDCVIPWLVQVVGSKIIGIIPFFFFRCFCCWIK